MLGLTFSSKLDWGSYIISIPKTASRFDIGPSLAASPEPLAYPRNVTNLSLFYSYYFRRCSSELAQLVPLPFS